MCGEGVAVNEIILTKAQHGDRVPAKTGDVLVIRLQENPTTGYQWIFRIVGDLTYISDDFILNAVSIGAGGERCLRFIAQHTGIVHIEAVLRRIWESDAIQPQDVFNVLIEVR